MRLLILITVGVVGVSTREVPDEFPICRRDDPYLEKCILNSVKDIRPLLLAGLPELNIPPIDPFIMNHLDIDTKLPQITLRAAVDDIVAQGAGDFEVEELTIDIGDKYAIELKILIPKLIVTAHYDTAGSKFIFFPINGRGNFKGTFTGVRAVVSIVLQPDLQASRDGLTYLEVVSVVSKVTIDSGRVQNQPEGFNLSIRAATAYFNSNSKSILRTMSPPMSLQVSEVLTNYLNDMFHKIPISDLFIK